MFCTCSHGLPSVWARFGADFSVDTALIFVVASILSAYQWAQLRSPMRETIHFVLSGCQVVCTRWGAEILFTVHMTIRLPPTSVGARCWAQGAPTVRDTTLAFSSFCYVVNAC